MRPQLPGNAGTWNRFNDGKLLEIAAHLPSRVYAAKIKTALFRLCSGSEMRNDGVSSTFQS